MTQIRKTLGALFRSQSEDEQTLTDTDSKEGADKKKDKQEDDQDGEDDAQEEEKDDKEKKKKPAAEESENEKEADAGQVTLSLEDYNQLFSLASETKETRKTNAALKVKADKWDAYEAALKGNKPAADSAGSKADEGAPEEVKEMDRLRSKHKGLMDDI